LISHKPPRKGCPSFRGVRKLGTTGLAPSSFVTYKNRFLWCTSRSAQPTPSLLRAGYLHFITTSCYQRLPLLGRAQNRDLLLQVLECVRRRYRFVVVGYVVMPEHVHLLLSEPERGDPSKLMQAIKQGFARGLLSALRAGADRRPCGLWTSVLHDGHIWQARFYDFVVFTEKKRIEKLRYMHRNPVKRGLAESPEQWQWSSYRHYAEGERGIVLVNEPQRVDLTIRKIA
jgi:putative transposase